MIFEDLFVPVKGDEENNREGDQVYIYDVDIKGYIEETGDDYNKFRIGLIWKSDANNGAPVVTEVFQNGGNIDYLFISHRNTQYYNKYRILADRVMTINDTEKEVQYFHIKKRINRKMFFKANNGLTSDKSSWGLFLYYVSDSGVATHPSLTYECKITFAK